MTTTLFCDSVTARGIAQRAGMGKVKALAVKTRWPQEVVRDRGLQIKAVSSKREQSRFRDESSTCGKAEPFASNVWDREPTCATTDEGGTDG